MAVMVLGRLLEARAQSGFDEGGTRSEIHR